MYGSSKFPAKSDFRYDDNDNETTDNGQNLENWVYAWVIAVKTWLWIIGIAFLVIVAIWGAFFAQADLAWLP
jgi:hypothetical protein